MFGATNVRLLTLTRLSAPHDGTSEQIRDRVRAILEAQLASVDSSQVATLTVHHALEAAEGMNEAALAEAVTGAPSSAVDRIAGAGRGQSPAMRVAAILVETARQALAPTEEAAAVAEAAYDVLGSGTHRVAPSAEHGRTLLRHATVLDLGSRESVEAQVFLALSSLPHPGWLHAVCEGVGSVATGGAIWVAGAIGAYLLRAKGGDRAVKLVVAIVPTISIIAERPAKRFFAPRRPFRHLVELMLLGRKPRGRSFPSGHAATSLAGAWLLSSVWPRYRPLFLGLATLVSLSRVYLGAHDPGEVLAGSVLGIALAEMLHRPTARVLAEVDLPEAPRAWRQHGGLPAAGGLRRVTRRVGSRSVGDRARELLTRVRLRRF